MYKLNYEPYMCPLSKGVRKMVLLTIEDSIRNVKAARTEEPSEFRSPKRFISDSPGPCPVILLRGEKAFSW